MNAIEIEIYLYFIRGNKWNRQTINEKPRLHVSMYSQFVCKLFDKRKKKKISDETKRMLILGCFDFFSFCVLFMLSPFRDYFGIEVPKQKTIQWTLIRFACEIA